MPITPIKTTIKKMHPKKGFIAPYIRFPWNQDRALIGKPVSIYKVDGGYFLSLKNNEFKPPNMMDIARDTVCSMNNEFKPKESLNSRMITLESQISEIYREIENTKVPSKNENQIIQNDAQNEKVSGRSKPPSVSAAFSYASYPDRYRAIHWSCSDLHPQGFAVSPIPVCKRSAGHTHSV